jgi:hypothetical protein
MVSSIENYFVTQMWFHDDQMDYHDIDSGTKEMGWREDMQIECYKMCREPISIDAHDSYASGTGYARGYVVAGGGCAPCVGATLPTSCKCRSMLS